MAEYEETHKKVEKSDVPQWATSSRKKELRAKMKTVLQQKASLQKEAEHLALDMNQGQSQTMFQNLISKMNQDVEYIKSTLEQIRSY